MRAAFVRQDWENSDQTIATFYFQPAGSYRYEAGQYAVLTVPHSNPDSRGTSRTMTLSSAPHEELLSFTMRIYPPTKSSSFKQALLRLQPGDEVTVYESMGDLVLPLNSEMPLVFVAGGVGIASFTGMIKQLTADNDQRDVTLLYNVSRPGDIVLQQPFDDYEAKFPLRRKLFVTGGEQAQRLTAQDVHDVSKPDTLIYLSGTEAMVESLRAGLHSASVPRSQIVFDYFDGYSEL